MKEQDINKIAALEQAISKKYGEEAIKNPKSNWTDEKELEYLEQLKKEAKRDRKNRNKSQKLEMDGFLVDCSLFKRETNRQCSVCNTYSFDVKDDVYMNKFECCFKCYIRYVEDREERWKNGYRPI